MKQKKSSRILRNGRNLWNRTSSEKGRLLHQRRVGPFALPCFLVPLIWATKTLITRATALIHRHLKTRKGLWLHPFSYTKSSKTSLALRAATLEKCPKQNPLLQTYHAKFKNDMACWIWIWEKRRRGFWRWELNLTYCETMAYGMVLCVKEGCTAPARLQLTLMYTGLLSFRHAETALSICSCALSKQFMIACWHHDRKKQQNWPCHAPCKFHCAYRIQCTESSSNQQLHNLCVGVRPEGQGIARKKGLHETVAKHEPAFGNALNLRPYPRIKTCQNL